MKLLPSLIASLAVFAFINTATSVVVLAQGDILHTIHASDIDLSKVELCDSRNPTAWRNAQELEGIAIAADPSCNPDRPELIAASVKGTNNVSVETLNASGLSPDAVIKGADLDGDGDPDEITINLEIWGLNEGLNSITNYEMAPGISPAYWVFAPKATDMVTESMSGAHLARLPSPTIRVEQGDVVKLIVANTHYLPHTVHLHGVDHPFVDENGEGNDGVPHGSEVAIMPGESREYNIQPRTAGSMAYHCHVQPQVHVPMGLSGLFVIEENKPNNWVQTLNVGAGFVRHSSAAVKAEYAGEYDLLYQDADKELQDGMKRSDDPADIAHFSTLEYDITERTTDYYTLNGKSFPYTLRESLVIVEPNEKYRMRVLNMGEEQIALHTHGHKFKIRALDGIDLTPEQRYYRDVISVDTAQRVDFDLETVDDGLNSYGEGIWMLHDHHEAAVTTDGIEPGGNMSFIVYNSWMENDGMPDFGLTADMRPFFTKEFYERQVPVWQTYDPRGLFSRLLDRDSNATHDANSISTSLKLALAFLVVVAIFLVGRSEWRKRGSSRGSVLVRPLFSVAIALLVFVLSAYVALAQTMPDVPGIEGIHIMPDGSVMLGTGETVTSASVNADGMIVWEDGTLIKPLMDMRSADMKAATMPTTPPTKSMEKPATSMPITTTMEATGTSEETSHLGMEGIEGIHIMQNGSIMLGNGALVNDATIASDGMITLGSGETVTPVMDMRSGDGIRRTEKTAVYNENFDRLPLGCTEINGTHEIYVKAGVELTTNFPGTMFTYDEHSFENIPPCALVTITFENLDHVRHQFMVHGLPPETYPMNMFNIEVTGPGKETGSFIAPAEEGTLFVHCGVPEHEAKGMVAQLKIGSGSGDLPEVTRLLQKAKGAVAPLSPLELSLYGGAGLGLSLLLLYSVSRYRDKVK